MTAPKKRINPPQNILNTRLPLGVAHEEVRQALADIARNLGYVSHNRPEVGSTGHLLYAIATGKAMVINLEVMKSDNLEDVA